jgi:hypothetical protein
MFTFMRFKIQDGLIKFILVFPHLFFVIAFIWFIFWSNDDEFWGLLLDTIFRFLFYKFFSFIESFTYWVLSTEEMVVKLFSKNFLSFITYFFISSNANNMTYTSFVECPSCLLGVTWSYENQFDTVALVWQNFLQLSFA